MSYDDSPYPVALNLGAASSTFPQNIAEAIWKEAGAEYHEESGSPSIPCALAESDKTFTYGFGGASGPQIKTHLWTMIIDQKTRDLHLNNAFGEPLCVFSVLNSTNSTSYTLGQDFMRNAYVVFDMHNDKIALAQGRTDSGALNNSDVVRFEKYGAPIPMVQLIPEQSTFVLAIQAIMDNLRFSATSLYSTTSNMGAVPRAASITSREDGGELGKDDAFNLTGDLGTWLSIVLVTLVGLAVAYTVNYQRKSAKSHAGNKSVRDGSPTPNLVPTLQESDVELGSATSAPPTHESQPEERPQESRVSSQDVEVISTSAYMSPALPLVSQKDEEKEEPKSPAFPAEAKLKYQIPEEKVLGTWSDLRRSYL